MKKEELEKLLSENCKELNKKQLITKEQKENFKDYFSQEIEGQTEDKIISDESLFRDYSRLGERKVDFERIRNPFNLSKYTISSYEKTWFIFKNNIAEGPYNSYEMDNLFKSNEIIKSTNLGINKIESFRFDYFIEIVYPLPRVKSNMIPQNRIRAVKFMPSVSSQQNTAKKQNNENTPFKRTPFKKMPENNGQEGEEQKAESYVWKGEWMSAKKNFQTDSKVVIESYLVKSKNKTKTKFVPKSGKANYKLEMNDIIGNYTAIKKDRDDRQYVNLQKKIDFQQPNNVEEESESNEEPQDEEIDDFFDKMEVKDKEENQL